ncbi:MAG: serine/threonine protein kinase [Bacteroidetes bacterium]|nr:serine/threonine protein kinase [Bacteroidota bacterium]
MAKLIQTKHGAGAVNAGEERLLKFLEVKLPDNYYIVSNVEFANVTPQGQVQYLEYDCIVITPHALYHIENKDWSGRLEGDDTTWYLNDSEKPNPLKTVRFKTSVLASKLKLHNPSWSSAWIVSMLTLSHPRQNKKGLWGDCEKASYLLDSKLIDFISNHNAVKKPADSIIDIYAEISQFIAGISSPQEVKQRKEIVGYDIVETLELDKCYSEFLCKTKGMVTANKLRIKEYILDLVGLSPTERDKRTLQIKNQQMALAKMQRCPFILNAQFILDEENHRFYEITDFLDESSLRAELRRKTFTQEEKLGIIFNLIEALRIAHKAEVYHRDLNPENIYLTSGCAALANFGKAYFADHGDMGYTVAPTINENNATAYHAPELLAKDASRASDIYSLGVLIYELFTGKQPFASPYDLNKLGGKLTDKLMPTAVKIGLPDWLDELCRHTILWDDTERWNNIEELDNFLKEQLSNSHISTATQQAVPTTFEELKPGLRIGDFTLYNELGKGGFSIVFRAKHNIQGKDYAIKIFNESISMQTVVDEYNALANLNNPNIVKFSTNGTLPNGQFYTLMEYLDGENLQEYTKGDLKLPLPIVYLMAKEILNALAYMQSQKPLPILHRDIKPQNIVWDKKNRFVLIDFNVATALETDKNFVGTNPYLAPDLISGANVNWDNSADTFALGITLYELICHSYPWSGGYKTPRIGIDPEPLQVHQPLISDAFADFITKAINCDKNKRYGSAQAMLDELLAVTENNLLKVEETLTPGDVVLVGEKEDKDFLGYLNSLYSQSRYGNVGTRASFKTTSFDELTYTKTKLDTKLLNAISAGMYRLVIITGNAGDGKTAFIKQIERETSNVERFTNRNGAKFLINGIPYQSNYDGSQDEENRANNEVLSDFFKPFEHTNDFSSVPEGRIIAINEGRLVDFLQSSTKFDGLYEIIDNYFYSGGHTELAKGLMIINLNLRSVTAKSNGNESLFRSQIKKLTQPALWSKCTACPHAGYCFTKYNVDTLSDGAAGDEVINRLEWLMRTISYKRELHITMRDLRSFIAYMISRDCSCADIPELFQKYSEQPEKYWQYFYFNITSPDAEPSNDRLISLMRDADLSQVSIPSIDRDLYFDIHHPKDYLNFSDRLVDLLDMFNANKMLLPAYEIKDEILEKLKLRHRSFVRHQYFEGIFDFKKRLPYQSLEDFYKLLTDSGNNEDAMLSAKQSLAQAISISEGCTETRLAKDYLLLRSSRVSDPISQSFRRFSIDDFDLFVNKSEHLVQYIEYESDSIIFRNKEEEFISLTVSLDLYEMLFFIKQGFSPSINDMRGRFIELQVFKNLLENKSYNEVLVTKNNKSFSVISLDQKTNKLAISPLNL